MQPLPEWAAVHLFAGLVPVGLAGLWLRRYSVFIAAMAAIVLVLYKPFEVDQAAGIWAVRFAIIFFFVAAIAIGMLSERIRFESRFSKKTVEDLKSILEKSIDGVFVIKRTDVIFANDRLVELLGFKREELIGRQIYELFHEEDAKILRTPARHNPTHTGTILDAECRMRKSGGGFVRVKIKMIRSPFGGPGAMMVYVHELENGA